MYEKILNWHKTQAENSPLSAPLVVCCIRKVNHKPENYFIKRYGELENFINSCKIPTVYDNSDESVKAQFRNESGFDVSDFAESKLINEIISYDNINDYINSKNFNSQNEIKLLCNKIYNDFLNERCFLAPIKDVAKVYGQRGVSFVTQMQNLGKGVDNRDKWADGTANQFWFGSNAIRCITERMQKLLVVEQTPELYRKSVIELKENFDFSDLQIEMLKYFICQSRDGDCPEHKTKALFFWGKNKGVGKTTIASTLICILNGETDIDNLRRYKSNLPTELGFKDFIAPLICSCRAVLMDEAMPKDSSKSYGLLKDRLTSFGAKVRFVFKNQVDIDARPNYIFVSNDNISTFIQDEEERRFCEFNFENRKKQLSYKEIYAMFLRFAQQCKREKEWFEWYDELEGQTVVKGTKSFDIQDIDSYFETASFLQELKNGASQISIGTFYNQVFKFEKNAEKDLIRECVIKKFGQPRRPSMWYKSDIVEILSKENLFNVDDINDDNLPF